MAKLKKNLKTLRCENGLTLLEVANYLGVREATVQRYESGKIKHIKYDTICKLAALYHCEPSHIMGWDDEPEPEPIILSPEELEIISAYRSADAGIKDAIAKLLDIDRHKKEKLAM